MSTALLDKTDHETISFKGVVQSKINIKIKEKMKSTN